jgi:DHA2 family multidrug resistance protein
MAFASWQLSYITLSTPYSWLQVLFVMRGLALGLIIQPLSVWALSDIHPRKLAQASSLYTVVRFVSTSLGIAVLATLVQSQAKVHATQLAAQITPASPLARLAAHLQAQLIQGGASPAAARAAALRQIAKLVQQQGYLLAIQDAFWFVMFVLIAAVIAAFFIRMRRHSPSVQQEGSDQVSTEVQFHSEGTPDFA